MERYTNPSSGREYGEFTWCAACRRADRTAAWDRGIWACPHCDGIARDARPWEEVRQVASSYPVRPEAQEFYPWPADPTAEAG